MYLLCKYIHENTDLKVILTGEVSDELFGYKYTDFAPSASEFQRESQKRIKELYMYDVLRADRCISAHALESRVPFADIDFVDYVMSINPAKKMNSYNKGKYLLRKAFDGQDYLPQSLLYREKAAFSDAVGHSLVDYLKAYAEEKYTSEDLEAAKVNNIPTVHLSQKNLFSYIEILLKNIMLEMLNGLRISGCQINLGKAVMLMIQVLEFYLIMVIVENKIFILFIKSSHFKLYRSSYFYLSSIFLLLLLLS